MKKENWVENEKQFYRIVYLISSTLLLSAFLNSFLLNSTLGYSLFVGYCFFIAVIFFNKKAFKPKKTEKEALNSGDSEWTEKT